MDEKLQIGVAVPGEWSLKYQLKGGGLTDLQEYLEATFPQFDFSTGGLTNESSQGTLQLFQVLPAGSSLTERIPGSVLEEVAQAVTDFFEPTNRPAH